MAMPGASGYVGSTSDSSSPDMRVANTGLTNSVASTTSIDIEPLESEEDMPTVVIPSLASSFGSDEIDQKFKKIAHSLPNKMTVQTVKDFVANFPIDMDIKDFKKLASILSDDIDIQLLQNAVLQIPDDIDILTLKELIGSQNNKRKNS
jgi:hypothetical protein